MTTDAEGHLRSLGERCLSRVQRNPADLLVTSSQLQGVANAFVVLGLLLEARAEAALADHRRAIEGLGIELHGVRIGELTLQPGSAYGFAEASSRGESDLRELPLAFSTPRARVRLADADLVLDCLVLTRTGLRGRMWLESRDVSELPPWPELVQDLSLTDDAGRSFRVRFAASGSIVKPRPGPPSLVRPRLAVSLRTEPSLSSAVQWLDFATSNSPAIRVRFAPPSSSPSGIASPAWPTPAENYLAWFANGLPPTGTVAEIGVGLTATGAWEIVDALTDALLAIAALPPHSAVLRQLSAARRASSKAGLTRQFVSQVSDQFSAPSTEQNLVALGARLPLQGATVTIAWMIVRDGVAHFELYASPDIRGEYWPVATRSFEIRATDNLGGEHEAIGATYWRGQSGEGWGELVLWPPLAPKVQRLRFQVNTLWEAAWVEIELST